VRRDVNHYDSSRPDFHSFLSVILRPVWVGGVEPFVLVWQGPGDFMVGLLIAFLPLISPQALAARYVSRRSSTRRSPSAASLLPPLAGVFLSPNDQISEGGSLSPWNAVDGLFPRLSIPLGTFLLCGGGLRLTYVFSLEVSPLARATSCPWTDPCMGISFTLPHSLLICSSPTEGIPRNFLELWPQGVLLLEKTPRSPFPSSRLSSFSPISIFSLEGGQLHGDEHVLVAPPVTGSVPRLAIFL